MPYCKYLLCNRNLLLLLIYIYKMTTCKNSWPKTFEQLHLIFAWRAHYKLDKYNAGKTMGTSYDFRNGFQARIPDHAKKTLLMWCLRIMEVSTLNIFCLWFMSLVKFITFYFPEAPLHKFYNFHNTPKF